MTVEKDTQPTETAKPEQKTTATKDVVALSVKKNADSGVIKQLPNNRPIETSNLNVVSTYSAVGGTRPIVASDIEVSSTLAISGNRPIAASHLKISETYSVMGSRPVASNEIEDPAALMGYLD